MKADDHPSREYSSQPPHPGGRKQRQLSPPAIWQLLIASGCILGIASAEQFGDFTYAVEGDTVTITDYPDESAGPVVIPAAIAGLPVTAIASYAFENCGAITSVSIPTGVSAIGENAFAQCVALSGIRIPAGVTIIEGSTFEGCDALVNVSLPASVTQIASFAFADCGSLAAITIPASVTATGNNVFDQCVSLKYVFFMGNAPTLGDTVFEGQSLNPFLVIHYFTGKVGFSTPTWQPPAYQISYQTSEMGPENPLTPWLIRYSLPANSNLEHDVNGDGVNLLMAYALDLDPTQNLRGSLPQPAISGNLMNMSFYAGSAGVTYLVKTSHNLTDWTTTGVTLSAPDAYQIRTASVSLTDPARFLRLELSY